MSWWSILKWTVDQLPRFRHKGLRVLVEANSDTFRYLKGGCQVEWGCTLGVSEMPNLRICSFVTGNRINVNFFVGRKLFGLLVLFRDEVRRVRVFSLRNSLAFKHRVNLLFQTGDRLKFRLLESV